MSDVVDVLLISERQSLRSQTNAALAGQGFALHNETALPTAVRDGTMVIFDAVHQTAPDVIAQSQALADRGLRAIIVVEPKCLNIQQRAEVRSAGMIEILSRGFMADDLLIRLRTLCRRGEQLRLLVIEDDIAIARELGLLLDAAGYRHVWASDVDEARAALATTPFDLLLVDRNLPNNQDGLELVRTLRAGNINVPAIMLTARVDPRDRVEGLRAGANDYLCKPFSSDELLARIEVALSSITRDGIVRFGALEIRASDRLARWHNAAIDLTRLEYDLLVYFVERRGICLPFTMLLADVWNRPQDVEATNVVSVGCSRLRRKLDQAGVPPIIQTVGDDGYSFNVAPLLGLPA